MDGKIQVIKKGDVLIREGNVEKDIFWLIKGELAVEKGGKQIATITKDNLVGELSFIDDLPRSATVKVLEGGEVARLDSTEFQTLIEKQPKWVRKLILTLATRLRTHTDF